MLFSEHIIQFENYITAFIFTIIYLLLSFIFSVCDRPLASALMDAYNTRGRTLVVGRVSAEQKLLTDDVCGALRVLADMRPGRPVLSWECPEVT